MVSAFDVLGSGPIGTFGTPSDGKTMSCANGAPVRAALFLSFVFFFVNFSIGVSIHFR